MALNGSVSVVTQLSLSGSLAMLKRHSSPMFEQVNQTYFSTLSEYLPGVAFCCRINSNWTMLHTTPNCYSLTGFHPEELVDDHSVSYLSLIFEEDRDRIWCEINDAIKNDKHYDVNYRITTKEGEEKWVWEKGIVRRHSRSGADVIEGFIIDITERKHVDLDRIDS